MTAQETQLIQSIRKHTCIAYGITEEEFCTKGRRPRVTEARHMAMTIADFMTEMTSTEICKVISYPLILERTALNHAKKVINDLCDVEKRVWDKRVSIVSEVKKEVNDSINMTH